MNKAVPLFSALFLAAFLSTGCGSSKPSEGVPQPYVDRGYRQDIPAFMRGTIYERADIGNTDPYPVTGYSVVVNLNGTGDNSSLPLAVRQAMIKRLALSGFGGHDDPRLTNVQPEQVLADPHVAVVRVLGMLPPGARRGQAFDVTVQAMPRSRTSSLAHGHMYNAELRNRGLELPGSGGDILAYAESGDVFVNPVYALDGTSKPYPGASPTQVSASLRSGLIFNSGRVTDDRPIILELRVPQASIARSVETRINYRFPRRTNDRAAAAAQDNGRVDLYVPVEFAGDWRHFVEVVNHLYLNDSPDFAAVKVRQLIDEAHKPAAALSDISYCLEALGPAAVPLYREMIADPNPAIAYAAARAAVFCGDNTALEAITEMAVKIDHPFELPAVHTLGELPPEPVIDKRLEPLLASDQALVRIEAYKILADHGDRRIISQDVPAGFKIDLVNAEGPPLIYAARSGAARFAIFGSRPRLSPPVVLGAMEDRLTISSDDLGQSVTIFYRQPGVQEPVRVRSGLNMSELISRLGGMAPPGDPQLNFSYGDVVAIVQALSEQREIVADGASAGQFTPFVLDQPAELTEALLAAALDSRPQQEADMPAPKTSRIVEPGPAPAQLPGPSADQNIPASPAPAPGGDQNQAVPSFGQ